MITPLHSVYPLHSSYVYPIRPLHSKTSEILLPVLESIAHHPFSLGAPLACFAPYPSVYVCVYFLQRLIRSRLGMSSLSKRLEFMKHSSKFALNIFKQVIVASLYVFCEFFYETKVMCQPIFPPPFPLPHTYITTSTYLYSPPHIHTHQ